MSQAESPAPYTPVEEPNSLVSSSKIRILDILCEGPISGFVIQSGAYGADPLCSTYFDDVQVRNLDGSYNFNASGSGLYFNYRIGETGQSVIPRFEKIENIVPLSSNTRLALPPVGTGPVKNVVASINTDIYPDADAVKITIKLPSLYQATAQGDIKPFDIRYAVDISLNNGPFVEQQLLATIGKCTSTYLADFTYALPKTNPPQDYYEWKVRVRRTTPNIMSAGVNNESYVDSICVISNSSFTYPSTALVGLELSADQFSSVPTRAYEIMGTMVSIPNGYKPTVYHGDGSITQAVYPEIWNGEFTTEKKWTDNPAWIFYDLLTNKRYGLGKYIKNDWVDKWTLYEIAQYCDELVDNGEGGLEPRFTCNVVLQQRTSAYELLLNLSSVFRGMLYWTNGRLFSTYTNDRSPIFNFTNANVIDGQFTYSDTAKNTRSTVIKVRWTNPKNLYRESIEYVEDTDGILKYGYIEKDITAFACTSKGQALRIANWALQTEKLLTETVTFQVGLDGNYIRPGDIFNVYDNFRNNNQQGGRIKSFDGTRLELDRPVTLQSGFTYALSVVNPNFNLESVNELTGSNQIPQIRNSQIEDKRVLSSAGTNITSLLVDSDYSNLRNGAIWMLYSSGNVPSVFLEKTQYRCLALSETQEKNIEILGLINRTGLNYSIETGYSARTVPVNPVNLEPIDPPSNLNIEKITGLQINNSFFSYFKITWDATPSTNLARYNISGQAPGGEWEWLTSSQATRANYPINYNGRYNFKVSSISVGGVTSSYISGGYDVSNGNPLGGPPSLSGLYLSQNYDQLLVNGQGYYTGYVGVEPEIKWRLTMSEDGLLDPKTQFLSGYRVNILDPNTNLSISTPVTYDYTVKGHKLNRSTFQNLTNGERRCLKIYVETFDIYGNYASGASLVIDNPAPSQQIVTPKFYADQDNLHYSIIPNIKDKDISGIYLWYNTGAGITPTFNNNNEINTSLSSTLNPKITGNYSVYWSIIDTFGRSGCSINGPTNVTFTNVTLPTGILAALNSFSGAFESSLTGSNTYISGLQSQINVLNTGLSWETNSRISGFNTLLSGQSGTSLALITGEIYARQTGDAAEILARQLQIASLSGYTTGAIYTTNTTFSNATGSLASSITTLFAGSGTLQAAINNEITARQTGDAAETQIRSTQISSLSGYTSSAIQTVNTTFSNATGSLANSITTLFAATGNILAAISQESTTRQSELEALSRTTSSIISQMNANDGDIQNALNTGIYAAASVQTVQTALTTASGVLASQTTNVQAKLDATGAIVQTLNTALITGGQVVAKWGMKVSAGAGSNKAIAGIETIAQGGESPISAVRFLANILQVCSEVDGTTYTPFQIISGVTYINEAMIKDASIDGAKIKDASIDSAKIGDYIQSNSYVYDATGWRISKNGDAVFSNSFRAGTGNNYIRLNNNGFKLSAGNSSLSEEGYFSSAWMADSSNSSYYSSDAFIYTPRDVSLEPIKELMVPFVTFNYINNKTGVYSISESFRLNPYQLIFASITGYNTASPVVKNDISIRSSEIYLSNYGNRSVVINSSGITTTGVITGQSVVSKTIRAQNGYMVGSPSSDTKIQHGYATPTSNGTIIITYPTPFLSMPTVVVSNNAGAGNNPGTEALFLYVCNVTASQFQVQVRNFNLNLSNNQFSWMAIGV